MQYRTRTITANPHRRKTSSEGKQHCRYSFGEVTRSIDRHPAGTHAGLEHIAIALLSGSTIVGHCDIHMHHNKKGLSIGTTTVLYTNQTALHFQG